MYENASAQALPDLSWEQGSIALWESTLLTTYLWLFDARIGYVESDGNWSLTLKGRVLEYDGNMASMSNDSRKLRKTFC